MTVLFGYMLSGVSVPKSSSKIFLNESKKSLLAIFSTSRGKKAILYMILMFPLVYEVSNVLSTRLCN